MSIAPFLLTNVPQLSLSSAKQRGVVAVLTLVLLAACPLHAQRPKPMLRRPGKPDINTQITEPKVVRVVSDENKPLADAEVRIGWWEDADGDLLLRAILDPPKTNAEGKVLISVPQGAVRAQISAVAPGYASAGTQYSLSGEPKIVLSKGQIVRVLAVDAEDKPIEDAIPLLERSRVWPREFKPEEGSPGVFVSPVVDLDRRWMRVVDANGDGPTRYSELIDIRNPPNFDEQGNIVAVLRPGVSLKGRLDDSVPRPVSGGCVELYIREGEGHRIERNSWTWQDTAEVASDGTFTFESLPTGGHVQLVALVDGYQSKRPTAESLANYLFEHDAGETKLIGSMTERNDAFWPQLFPLPLDQESIDVELACVPTAHARIRVVDAIGQPISKASIRFNPNGYFLGGELFIPGTEGFAEAARLGESREKLSNIRKWATAAYLNVTTNDQGIATVSSLASDTRQTFDVEADGYQLPVYPSSSKDYPSRYATLDVAPGETTPRTVTLEKERATGPRELSVLDSQGQPLDGIEVIITDVALEDAEDEWYLWSVARMGEVVSAASTEGGRIQFTTPLELDGKRISRLKLFLKGNVGRRASVFGERLEIPVRDDGRVIVLTVSEDPPRDEHSYRKVTARYVRPEEVIDQSPKQLLERLVQLPTLIVLKQLLATANFTSATPIELEPRCNSLKLSDRTTVELVETEQGPRVVVLCRVQPAGAPPAERTSQLPEAAFVFDAKDASLKGMVGGWSSGKGHPCDLSLTDLGPSGDYFFQVTASDENGPYSQLQQWTLVGQLDSPALTVFSHRRDPAWSADSYQTDKLSAEFGYLEYSGTESKRGRDEPGWLESGAKVPRKIFWDGRQNKFIGLPELWVESEPLYKVDIERSSAFEPLKVSPDDIVAGGGRRSYENWHAWDVAIPAGEPAQLKLLLVNKDDDGKEQVVEELSSWPLASGLHFVQLNVTNGQDEAKIELRPFAVEGAVDQKFTVPQILLDVPNSVSQTAVLRAAEKQLDLLRYATQDEGVTLLWRLNRN